MLKRALLLPFLLILLVASGVPCRAESAAPAELETLIAEALAHNPEIRGSEAQWRMAVAKSQQAGSFDDPMLMLKIQNAMISDPLAFDQDPMTGKVIGVSQMVPFYGKRGLARTGATKEAEAAHWNLEERKVELRRMVSETWAQLAYLQTSLQLVEKNITLLDDIARLAEASYSAGMGKQPDILRVQIERSRMEEMKLGLLQQERSQQALMKALLHRDDDERLVVPAGTITQVERSRDELLAQALATRPELLARTARIDKAAADERLATREYYPDFTLSFEYMQRDAFTSGMASSDGADMYSAGISFNLPVQLARRRAMVAESHEQKLMAEAEVDGLRTEMRRSIDDLLARLDASAGMAKLYHEGVVPQSEVVQESTLAAFRAGRVEFMSVLDSRMKLFGAEQQLAGFIAEHEMLRAQLEATVGTRLE